MKNSPSISSDIPAGDETVVGVLRYHSATVNGPALVALRSAMHAARIVFKATSPGLQTGAPWKK